MATVVRYPLGLNIFAVVATPAAGAYVLVSEQGLENRMGWTVYVLVLSALAVVITVASVMRDRRSLWPFATQAASVALYFALVMAIISSVGVYFVLQAIALLAALWAARQRAPHPVEPQ